jgi:hypothetical protein
VLKLLSPNQILSCRHLSHKKLYPSPNREKIIRSQPRLSDFSQHGIKLGNCIRTNYDSFSPTARLMELPWMCKCTMSHSFAYWLMSVTHHSKEQLNHSSVSCMHTSYVNCIGKYWYLNALVQDLDSSHWKLLGDIELFCTYSVQCQLVLPF